MTKKNKCRLGFLLQQDKIDCEWVKRSVLTARKTRWSSIIDPTPQSPPSRGGVGNKK